jgi:hypothetical protein
MPRDDGTPDYGTMLRTAVKVQGALARTCWELGSRWAQFSAHETARVADAIAVSLRADPARRQSAAEATLWGCYVAHEELLRGITGAGRLGLLVLLNEIDRRRGPRPVGPDAAGAPRWGD